MTMPLVSWNTTRGGGLIGGLGRGGSWGGKGGGGEGGEGVQSL